MKKRLIFVFALCLTFSLCLFAGCSQGGTSGTQCAHEYGEWQTNSYATCSHVGWQTRTCYKCGEAEWAEIAKTQHVTEIVPATEATCYSTGNEAGAKCSVCGEILVYPQTIQKKEHDYGDWINDEAATCAKEGKRHKLCKTEGCTSRIDEVIPVTGSHDYVNVGDKCSVCGELKPSEGLEFSDDWNGYCVAGKGTCKDLNIVIPSTYNSKPVTGIEYEAFFDVFSLDKK